MPRNVQNPLDALQAIGGMDFRRLGVMAEEISIEILRFLAENGRGKTNQEKWETPIFWDDFKLSLSQMWVNTDLSIAFYELMTLCYIEQLPRKEGIGFRLSQKYIDFFCGYTL